MIVIGYERETNVNEDGTLDLIIPLFHTGHLGLLPGTELKIYELEKARGIEGYEIIITPIPQHGNIVKLDCILENVPGAMSRLVDVISNSDINIITQEVTMSDHCKNILINMILDFGRQVSVPQGLSLPNVLNFYKDYNSIIPVQLPHCIKLFENIMDSDCRHLVVWNNTAGYYLPQLNLIPYHFLPNTESRGFAFVKSVQTKNCAKIKMDRETASLIIQQLDIRIGNPVSYVAFSETEEKRLRVYFPNPAKKLRIYSLGVSHENKSGALSIILRLLAVAGFDIVTSVIRKKSSTRNFLEVVVEYLGSSFCEHCSGNEEQCNRYEVISEKIIAAAYQETVVEELKEYDITIGPPLFPIPKKADKLTSINTLIDKKFRTKNQELMKMISENDNQFMRLENTLNNLQNKYTVEEKYKQELYDAKALLFKRIAVKKNKIKTRVFLSFPKTANTHARMLEHHLNAEGNYDIVIYEPDGNESVTQRVKELILGCDILIGIWHHEKDEKGDLSPWMYFEYGIAKTAEIEILVVHSEKLPDETWKRLDGGTENHGYSDLTFQSKTIPLILKVCQKIGGTTITNNYAV